MRIIFYAIFDVHNAIISIILNIENKKLILCIYSIRNECNILIGFTVKKIIKRIYIMTVENQN